jgi:uncharacterized phiE125 gp8 family phage protein
MAETKAPPAVLLDELKAWLRIEDNSEDPLLYQCLHAATDMVETHLGWVLVERNVREAGRLSGGTMRLTVRPVQSLISVMTGDENEVPQALVGRIEQHERGGAVIVVENGNCETVRVLYRAGAADNWNAVAEGLRMAILRLAGHFHANRDSVDDPGFPISVARLLAPYRDRRIGVKVDCSE